MKSIIMHPLRIPAAATAIFLGAILAAFSAETLRYEAEPGGSKMKIDGTSTLHDWTVVCGVIGGFMELDATFPDGSATPSAVTPRVEVSIPVRQLKSGKKSMDTVMLDAMKQEKFPKIEYKMIGLKPKAGAAGQFDATGSLTIAGVTRTNTMAVTIARADGNKLKVTGGTAVKMTDFGIKPPSPDVPGLSALIKTGDEVKLSFEWITAKAAAK